MDEFKIRNPNVKSVYESVLSSPDRDKDIG